LFQNTLKSQGRVNDHNALHTKTSITSITVTKHNFVIPDQELIESEFIFLSFIRQMAGPWRFLALFRGAMVQW